MLRALWRFLTDREHRDALLLKWHLEGESRPSIPVLW